MGKHMFVSLLADHNILMMYNALPVEKTLPVAPSLLNDSSGTLQLSVMMETSAWRIFLYFGDCSRHTRFWHV
jgi:hypothetical protein